MTANAKSEGSESRPLDKLPVPLWIAAIIILLVAAVVVLLGLLAVSIMERRWEAQRPVVVLRPLGPWEPNNAVWGQNYPRQYESYLKSRISDTKTKFAGSFPRDYLEEDPYQVILYAGTGFWRDYIQARGHYWSLTDVVRTKRTDQPFVAATCWTCKSTDVPRLIHEMGVRRFYAANFHDLKAEMRHPVGCQDCHDPNTLNLRVTRPAVAEAFEVMGRDINDVTHQEMRSLVCAQCHVEYYFVTNERHRMKDYLRLPWAKGRSVEEMLAYYEQINFHDYIHAISQTPIVKSQHPDYEMYLTGIHSYRDVACADCHMPYRTQGGMKFTDHHVQSPLVNIANSCAVCHRWSEDQIQTRVEAIQTKVHDAMLVAEEALVRAHFDIAAAIQAGATQEQLARPRRFLRQAQFRWDYVSSNNGMGFHSPQESMRILGDSANQAQQVRLLVARLLAEKQIAAPPRYPDVSTRRKAEAIVNAFMQGEAIKLLP
jgi:nitrite reductase (cytochrome c-552)